MNESSDDITGIILGILGGGMFVYFMDINWQTAWEQFGNLLWLGFVAAFSGVMGYLGKQFAAKIFKRKNKEP